MATSTPLRFVIVSGSLGAGHDGPANEMVRRLRAVGHVATKIDFLDCVPAPVAVAMREGYRLSAIYAPRTLEWMFNESQRDEGASGGLLKLALHVGRRRLFPRVMDADVVVSTYPFAAQALGALRERGVLRSPVVTYIIDPAPHAVWLHHRVDHHFGVTIATSEVAQARYGVTVEPVGALVAPQFRRPVSVEAILRVRRSFGVDASSALALVTAGSGGLGRVVDTARAVGLANVIPVVLCGRNDRVRRKLLREGTIALAWRDDVATLMSAADVVVQNASGLTLAESLVVGVPAVTYEPVAGHGRLNAAVAHEYGLAPWATSESELVRCIASARIAKRAPILRDENAVSRLLEIAEW